MTDEKLESWRVYQHQVAEFFRKLGCSADVEKKVTGARNTKGYKVDVWVTHRHLGLDLKIVVECKHWKDRVERQNVTNLKGVVDDIGANFGILVCENGFQEGAYLVAANTNLLLVSSLEELKDRAKKEIFFQDLVLDVDYAGTGTLYRLPRGGQPSTLLLSNRRLFAAVWNDSHLLEVDYDGKKVTNVVELDKFKRSERIGQYPPGDMVIAGGTLFVGQVFSKFLLVIDLQSNEIIERIPIEGEGKFAIAPGESEIYFGSNKENAFYRIDPQTFSTRKIPYKTGWRGTSSIYAHPDGRRLFIGIQRGGITPEGQELGGNSRLAVYDLRDQHFITSINLANPNSPDQDVGTPHCITYSADEGLIYVGMFQSSRGIIRIDERSHQIVDSIEFEKKFKKDRREWVDPLSQIHLGSLLFTLNRNNYELAILDKRTREVSVSLPLGGRGNGPMDFVIIDDVAVVSHNDLGGLLFIELAKEMKGWPLTGR